MDRLIYLDEIRAWSWTAYFVLRVRYARATQVCFLVATGLNSMGLEFYGRRSRYYCGPEQVWKRGSRSTRSDLPGAGKPGLGGRMVWKKPVGIPSQGPGVDICTGCVVPRPLAKKVGRSGIYLLRSGIPDLLLLSPMDVPR